MRVLIAERLAGHPAVSTVRYPGFGGLPRGVVLVSGGLGSQEHIAAPVVEVRRRGSEKPRPGFEAPDDERPVARDVGLLVEVEIRLREVEGELPDPVPERLVEMNELEAHEFGCARWRIDRDEIGRAADGMNHLGRQECSSILRPGGGAFAAGALWTFPAAVFVPETDALLQMAVIFVVGWSQLVREPFIALASPLSTTSL